MTGGGIIWVGPNGEEYYRKRGAEVLRSVQYSEWSSGFVGSDRRQENKWPERYEQLEPVVNESGEPLRFAVITRPEMVSIVRKKLARGRFLSIATSYPNIAATNLGDTNEYRVFSGGIEAELRDKPQIDAGFELVQSGKSLEDMELEVAEGGIEQVYLERVWDYDERA